MLSNSYDKWKFANEREEKQLRRRLKHIAKGHTDRLQTLHKDKCQAVAELRAHRVHELRNIVRDSLRMEQKIQKERMKFAQLQISRGEKTWKQKNEGRGFSKVDVESDEGFNFERRRPRQFSEYQLFNAAGADGEQDENNAAFLPPKVTLAPRDNYVVLYYPVGIHNKHKRNCHTSTLLPRLGSGSASLRVVDPIYGRTSLGQIPKKCRPSYVEELTKLEDEKFDQFTDGSMALEMRRFHQIQRERMPPLTGHLPVRMRYSRNFDAKRHLQDIRQNLLATESEEAASAFAKQRALGVLDPKKARHYIPKSKQGEEASRKLVMKDNQKLNKLKKANQAVYYKETLSRVDTFLGTETKGKELVHQETLTREEALMLKTLTMDPAFESLNGAGRKGPPPLRRAETRA